MSNAKNENIRFDNLIKEKINEIKDEQFNPYGNVIISNESGIIILLLPGNYFDYLNFADFGDNFYELNKQYFSPISGFNKETAEVGSSFIKTHCFVSNYNNCNSSFYLENSGYCAAVDNFLIKSYSGLSQENRIHITDIFSRIYNYIKVKLSLLSDLHFSYSYYINICMLNVKDFKIIDFNKEDIIHQNRNYKVLSHNLIDTFKIDDISTVILKEKITPIFKKFLSATNINKENFIFKNIRWK
jgi:hypothetical protein